MPRRTARVVTLSIAALAGSLAFLAGGQSPAWAGVGLGVTPEFPAAVTVGATGVPASLRIVNTAFGGEGEDQATLTDITLVPSCGIPPNAPPDVLCTGGVDTALRLSATATGTAGSACAGRAFTVTEIDSPSRRFRFAPDQPVVLGPHGSATDTCVIEFTFDVLGVPTKDAFPAMAKVQTTQVAFSAATFSPSQLTGSGTGTDVTTVDKAMPAISTQAPPNADVGDAVADVATLVDAVNPTGTITFGLFGPDDATCTGTAVFTSAVGVNGNGTYTSASFSPTQPGTYRWVASYSGDDRNAGVTAACGAANELTQVVATTTTTTSTTTTTTTAPTTTTSPPTTAPTTTAPTTTIAPQVAGVTIERAPSAALPRTGVSVARMVALGGLVIVMGAGLMILQRRVGRRRG